jgi:hypothetical protein
LCFFASPSSVDDASPLSEDEHATSAIEHPMTTTNANAQRSEKDIMKASLADAARTRS